MDLRDLPEDSLLKYGGIDLKPGMFAVVENAVYSTDEAEIAKSELFVPIARTRRPPLALYHPLHHVPIQRTFGP